MNVAFFRLLVSFGIMYKLVSAFHPLQRPNASLRRMALSSSAFSSKAPPLTQIRELDRLLVTVIVDNESDTMSSGLENVPGFEYRSEKSKKTALCRAGHGFSVLLQGYCGEDSHCLLVDAGPDPELWKQNADNLHIDASEIDAAVLSHFHWDHSAGLRGAVPVIAAARRQAKDAGDPLLVDLQSAEILQRGRPTSNGGVVPHKPNNPSTSELEQLGARVEHFDKEHLLCDNFFSISGYIPRLSDYETGIPNHVSLVNGKWVEDEEIADERYVAVKVRNRGLVIISSCSHAGITNVCRDAMAGGDPIFGIIGGFHLGGKQVENRISRTVNDLKEMKPSVVLAGHCSGWRAKAQLALEFPEHFQPLAVGATYVFSSESKE